MPASLEQAASPYRPDRSLAESSMSANGHQWKALPKEQFGSSSAIHRHFLRWQAAGFFETLWRAGLIEYDEMSGISEWQSIDGTLSKAPLAQSVGPNPTDREKKREQAEFGRVGAWHPVVGRRQQGRKRQMFRCWRNIDPARPSASDGLCGDAAVSERR